MEASLDSHRSVAEAAVVGFPDPVKGQALCCYVSLTNGVEGSPDLIKELRMQVCGPVAVSGVTEKACQNMFC